MTLVNQQKAVKEVKELFSLGDCFCDEYSIVGMLNSLPTQEIIHCKDCKHADWYEAAGGHYCYCLESHTMGRTETDFCSRGEVE